MSRKSSGGLEIIGLMVAAIFGLLVIIGDILKGILEFLFSPPGAALILIVGLGVVSVLVFKHGRKFLVRRAQMMRESTEQERKLIERFQTYKEKFQELHFYIPPDQAEILASLKQMSSQVWQKYLAELESRIGEQRELQENQERNKIRILEELRSSASRRARVNNWSPVAPNYLMEVFAPKNPFVDTDSVGFYKFFLSNFIKNDLPANPKKILELSHKTISRQPLLADAPYPYLRLKDHTIKPDRRELRFYRDGQFREDDFSNALSDWQSVENYNEEAKANFERQYYNHVLTSEKNRQIETQFAAEKKAHDWVMEKLQNYKEPIQQYENDNVAGITGIIDLQLANVDWPGYFQKKWEVVVDNDAKIVVIDFWLPAKTQLGFIKETKQLKTRYETKIIRATLREQEAIYNDFLFQICLALTAFVYKSDYRQLVSAIAFNGIIEAPDEATGIVSKNCVLSFMAKREEFQSFDLAKVVPVECFKRMRGVSSSQLSKMIAVRPVLQFNKKDKRFIEAAEVIQDVQGVNLAAIHWADFETLVRDIFSKEFSGEGAEVKVTRASKDGGVDAVVFDPDPIKGGKFVIQAKRYTNVVGVSAVRDLYGTVMNEGANRGILVTTSSYGPDAYEFAKDKPLTMINGSELLHLLQKHGVAAHIDLKAARAIMKASEEAS